MSVITLQEAADRLGVHYMTAYRYVRTGRLDATKEGALWQVDTDDLTAFIEGKDPQEPTAALTPYDNAWLRLHKRLVAGDEAGSWNIVEECLASGMTPRNLYERLITPAMTEVGERWAAGELEVADEHLATAIMTRLIGRLGPQFVQRGRSRGSVVLAMIAGDDHSLPTSMLADLLRLERFDVIDLGANTPGESVVKTARKADRLVAVGLCSVAGNATSSMSATLELLHTAGFGQRTFIGGGGVKESDREAISPSPLVTGSAQDVIDFVDGLTRSASTTSKAS